MSPGPALICWECAKPLDSSGLVDFSVGYAMDDGQGRRVTANPVLTTSLLRIAAMADASLRPWGGRFKDRTGQRFGRLTALSPVRKGNRAHWVCRCDCGRLTSVSGVHLTTGHIRSCGCLLQEVAGLHSVTHGKTRRRNVSPEYVSWSHMRSRCCNPKNNAFHNYGGRGITVCPEWMDNFQSFLDHIGPRPGKEYSVDRIDNNGNYEPGNVRWSTQREQMRNVRKSRRIEACGIVATLAEWSERTSINYVTLFGRLKRGWPPEKAFSTPAAPSWRRAG